MREVLTEHDRLARSGAAVGRAVVTAVFGSAPRPAGASLLVSSAGETAGSITGGCVEAAVAEEVRAAIRRGTPRLVSYGVSDETAWDAGLACGGTIDVWVEPRIRPEVLAAARGAAGRIVATVVGGPAAGGWLVVGETGAVGGARPPDGADEETAATAVRALDRLRPAVEEAALEALDAEASGTRVLRDPAGAGAPVFLEVFAPPPRLVVFGAGHVAAELVPAARRLGYATFVADARRALLTRERFPDADELIAGWPEEAFARIGLDRATCVCVLTHDPKLDDPALVAALRSPARYVGAIGSRKAQAARRERLRAAGLSEADVARLRAPIGLDLGGRRPAETALAILAEMTAVRYAAPAGSLDRSGETAASVTSAGAGVPARRR